MKLRNLVGQRFKERPADCVIDSHALMIRGGYMKGVGSGIFSEYPILRRVTRKIENIIREEMERIGGQEVMFPVVMPAQLWKESGRFESVGKELVRFKDRSDTDLVLGMTHEEAAVQLVREYGRSYQQYPFMIYQFQRKFRDEARPRAGMIRVREFTMKDAYSFHTSRKDVEEYYAKCLEAYRRIFRRVGIPQVEVVASDSGMMGGNVSHEFMLLTDAGEDSVVVCGSCDYRANLEAVDEPAACGRSAGAALEGVCPCCGSRSLSIRRGIEVGNIFQLGTKYTESMNMRYINESGAAEYPVMGCYGIGIGRLAASVCEARHDNRGPVWPISIAPWEVHLCCLRPDDGETREISDTLYQKLQSEGIEVIYDDRNKIQAGEMFADADLIGAPVRVIVSPRNTKDGVVEIVARDSVHMDNQMRKKVPVGRAFSEVCDLRRKLWSDGEMYDEGQRKNF